MIVNNIANITYNFYNSAIQNLGSNRSEFEISVGIVVGTELVRRVSQFVVDCIAAQARADIAARTAQADITFSVALPCGKRLLFCLTGKTTIQELKNKLSRDLGMLAKCFSLFGDGEENEFIDDQTLFGVGLVNEADFFLLTKPVTDKMILMNLFESCGGKQWRRDDGWDTANPIGTRFGVKTNEEGEVIKLNLYGNHLTGQIPAYLSDLQQLRTLILSNNKLTGVIPESLGMLKQLETLNLYNTQLNGVVPECIGELQQLRSFSAHGKNQNLVDQDGRVYYALKARGASVFVVATPH